MVFYFGKKKGDELMSKINLREISSRAKQWDHPVKGLFKYAESMKKCGGDILKLPKNDRERYCVSLVALAMMNDSKMDWWTNIPKQDPPDGLVMTLIQEKPDALKGYMREVEVVEHREKPEQIFNVILNKMTEKSYENNTILVCLALTPAVYDFNMLAKKLAEITSSLKHVFVMFAGISLNQSNISVDRLKTTFTMVQLLPVFEMETFDYSPYLDDFKVRYDKGQESRLTDGIEVHYATANPKFHHKK
ncbi:MAG: hypothetical protein COV70_02905 [Parcubacteria group bacterium CG11_big_fil_rev_8_21_14_0_20_39_22]|nr:MAG: hypothetical protein COV70_02905 [Parcubacteria group bacterium CG11_big_fil_rev_8_21_14_0_20_39_22]